MTEQVSTDVAPKELTPKPKQRRGFAVMSPNKQREIASMGGKAGHVKGTAHQYTSDEARSAGKLGGLSVATNREHMSAIGRLGGKNSAANRAKKKADFTPAPTNPA